MCPSWSPVLVVPYSQCSEDEHERYSHGHVHVHVHEADDYYLSCVFEHLHEVNCSVSFCAWGLSTQELGYLHFLALDLWSLVFVKESKKGAPQAGTYSPP